MTNKATNKLAAEERTLGNQLTNPFKEPTYGYFAGAGRSSYLKQLSQPVTWLHPIMLVTGVQDSGKSSLYKNLADDLVDDGKSACVRGRFFYGSRELFAAIVRAFNIEVGANANLQTLESSLIEFLQAKVAKGEVATVLIDDADLLEPLALESLIKILTQNTLRLVLFGESRIVPLVSQTCEPLGLGWYEMPLVEFTPADVRQYLSWRFRLSGVTTPLPFSEEQIGKIALKSQGLPGVINSLASVELENMQKTEQKNVEAGFPVSHLILVALLIAVVALLYALFGDALTGGGKPRQAVVVGEGYKRERNTDVEVDQAPAATELGEVGQPIQRLSVDEPVSTLTAPDISPTVAVEDSEASEVVQEFVVRQENSSLNPASSTATPAVPALKAPAAANKAPAAANKTPVATKTPSSGAKSGQWLLDQAAEKYTIQIVTVSSEANVRGFLDRQKSLGEFATYKVSRNSRLLYVIVYGIYDSRAQAENAAKNLPSAVGAMKPWIRSLQQIHKAIGNTSQT